MRIFYLLFSLYVLGHAYVFLCLRRAFGGGKWQIPVLAWLIAMALSWLWRFGRPPGPVGERFQDVSLVWMGFFIMLCYCLIACDLAALLARTIALVSQLEPSRRLASFLVAPRYVPLALCAALLLFAYALYEAQTPRVVSLRLETEKLPSGSPPLRIVGVADVHVSSIIGPRMLRRMAARIAEQQPDILVVAGDVVDSDMSQRAEDARILASIPADIGKFAVTGNHEFYHGLDNSLSFLEKSGLTVLRGQYAEAGGIVIAGIDDSAFRSSSEDTTDVMRLLEKVPADRFILLLNHKPWYPDAAVGRFDLQFSGHTHSGQFWPGMFVTRRIYGKEQGLNELEQGVRKSLLYITNGIGFWGPPIRFLAPPEIVVITLAPHQG